MQEDPVYFGSRRSLAGIVTLVPGRLGGGPNPFVILLNSGRVHRVGPNRMYVGLARTLAAKGFAVLRFDFSGIGDSCDDSTGRRFHEWARQDVQEAIDYLQGAYGAERCILFGICSGAQVGFACMDGDPRVVGAVLVESLPLHRQKLRQSFSTSGHGALLRTYRANLASPASWLRVLTGRSDLKRLRAALVQRIRGCLTPGAKPLWSPEDLAAEWRFLEQRPIPLLLVYAEWGETLDLYRATVDAALQRLPQPVRPEVRVIQGANHTFVPLHSQVALTRAVVDWITGHHWPACT